MLYLDAVNSRVPLLEQESLPVLIASLVGYSTLLERVPWDLGHTFPFWYHSLEAETSHSWMQRALWWLFLSTALSWPW